MNSVDLPVAGQVVIVAHTHVKFNRVQEHGHTKVEPSPNVSPSIASLICPPVGVVAVAASRGKVLHQEACVNGNEDAWAEPTDKPKQLADTITIIQRRLLR